MKHHADAPENPGFGENRLSVPELYKEPGILTKDRDRRGKKEITGNLREKLMQISGGKDARQQRL